MTQENLATAQEKMRQADVSPAAIDTFSHYYRQLETGTTGLIPEQSIIPYRDAPRLADVRAGADGATDALAHTAIIKLNGGLGTSMGLDKAKTLLPVREGLNFLDIIVKQVRAARAQTGARLPLLFMTSFRTDADTRQYLAKYPDLLVDGLPLTFRQSQEPKLWADDLAPVEWPADRSLEWCPPGHGDIYTALLASGLLDELVAAGYWYASIGNGDNLGAAPDAELAAWFAASGAPFAAEICRRTVNDKKGGHLARRRLDKQLILREAAQTPAADMHYFTDEYRHPFFNTNNLWVDLRALRDLLNERSGVLGLPLIRNQKTVDPADPNSPAVIQIETAMGAAIATAPGSAAIVVERDRFLPVKTTNELLLLRSDLYQLSDDGKLVARRDTQPEVRLEPRYYRTIEALDQRIPAAPSLLEAESLVVEGDWQFEPGVRLAGKNVFGSGGGRIAP